MFCHSVLAVTVELQVTEYSIDEGFELIGSYVCVSLNGALCRSVTVMLTTASGTATQGEVFQSIVQEINDAQLLKRNFGVTSQYNLGIVYLHQLT